LATGRLMNLLGLTTLQLRGVDVAPLVRSINKIS